MIKEIKYNGYTTSPDDYACPDGDLAACLNMVPDEGTLKPVLPPSDVFDLRNGTERLMFIHKSNSFVSSPHYIIIDRMAVFYRTELLSTMNLIETLTSDIYQVTSIGNTLLVLASDGMHYYLWKNGAYLVLGTHIPELPISFGLKGTMVHKEVINYNEGGFVDVNDVDGAANELDSSYTPNTTNTSNNGKEYPGEATVRFISDQILGQVNKFIKEETVDKGKFLYPFFVRYAYRLYDGTLSMHSCPVLMNACSNAQPMVIAQRVAIGSSGITHFNGVAIYGETMDLDYQVIDSAALTSIRNWGDIIKSVEVFISKPIYTYDQNGQVRSHSLDTSMGYCVCKDSKGTDYTLQKDEDLLTVYGYGTQKYNSSNYWLHFNLPARSDDQVADDIRNISQFYFLKTISLNDLQTSPTLIDIGKEYLQSLVNREAMTDDYLSHDTIMAKKAFSYNGRLNLTDITTTHFRGFRPDVLLERITSATTVTTQSVATLTDISNEETLYSDTCVIAATRPLGMYVYYPNTAATRMIVGGRLVTLEKSNFLNGSFHYEKNFTTSNLATLQATGIPTPVQLPNKIYTSEVNNPFYFPVLGINTVGTGDVMGISAAVKALSEGQFGQFPLYAFTTEGVWSLEVSDTGTYKARQPVTRDVCINADSITQIDTAVLFAADRGIMLLQGSNAKCISESLDDNQMVPITTLPNIDNVVGLSGFASTDFTVIPFRTYITGCRMIYDYPRQRIIVYNSSYNYAYVYSLKAKAWGMMQSKVKDNVDSYPYALATVRATVTNPDDIGRVVDLSKEGIGNYNGVIVTRPFKLDYPNQLKTVKSVTQRGYFRKGHIQCVLYGSRDLFNWFTVWSSQDHYLRGFSGTPYKYFRVVLLCNLASDENLYGCSVQYTPRLTNQSR